jgi:tRNA(His) 5'-end guanylyltransferase
MTDEVKEEKGCLRDFALEVFDLLKKNEPKEFDGLYTMPPFIPKKIWTRLGDSLKVSESCCIKSVPGDKYITLRLDGNGFSKMIPRLRKAKAFCSGYSDDFGRIMRECCTTLMEQFNSVCGYTQSDEITILIQPARVIRGQQMPHAFNGRVLKLCTLAATHVATLFNFHVSQLIPLTPQLLAKFDCRLGCYDTFEEAMSLILWRAYDCGVNGVSDACYHQRGKIAGVKQVLGQPTIQKLNFLKENGILPLPHHQEYGSYFVRVRRIKELTDPRTNQKVLRLRSQTEKVEGCVLHLAKRDQLLLQHDTEEDEDEDQGDEQGHTNENDTESTV